VEARWKPAITATRHKEKSLEAGGESYMDWSKNTILKNNPV
jgi:hypothetical protein